MRTTRTPEGPKRHSAHRVHSAARGEPSLSISVGTASASATTTASSRHADSKHRERAWSWDGDEFESSVVGGDRGSRACAHGVRTDSKFVVVLTRERDASVAVGIARVHEQVLTGGEVDERDARGSHIAAACRRVCCGDPVQTSCARDGESSSCETLASEGDRDA